ncbi:MAG TPA: hypothetical protein VFT95_21525 [Micromonosporaceae bacterium]|nr:hypothetical protein [Micromonosporaceae bacterium]
MGRASVRPELRATPVSGNALPVAGNALPTGVPGARHADPGVPGAAPAARAARIVPPDENTTLGLATTSNAPSIPEPADSPRQRARQSAARRYG